MRSHYLSDGNAEWRASLDQFSLSMSGNSGKIPAIR